MSLNRKQSRRKVETGEMVHGWAMMASHIDRTAVKLIVAGMVLVGINLLGTVVIIWVAAQ